jgi:hypothetical protein
VVPDDLGRASGLLASTAAELLEESVVLAGVTTAVVLDAAGAALVGLDADVLLAARRLDAAVGRAVGPGGAGREASELTALAVATRTAAEAYAASDRAVAAAGDAAADGVMALAALGLPLVLAGAVTVAGARLVAGGVVVTPEEVAAVDRAAHDHPWLVDLVGRGARGFVGGLAALGPGVAWALAAACAADGRRFPPRTDAEAVGVLAAVGSLAGVLDESPAGMAAVPVVREVPVAAGSAAAPVGVAGLVAGDVAVGASPGRVRVVEVPQADGSSAWVVHLPGTQEWSPRAGENPVDLTTDVRAMAGNATVLAAGAARALESAQRSTGRDTRREPVLLTGHSQGGIVAAAMAADPGFTRRHRLTTVVVAGSPVARFPVPRTVSVLALEHARDPVPRLDGLPNPSRTGWLTVTRDLPASATGGRAGASHAGELYVGTAGAVDRVPPGAVPSLDAWRRSAEPFLTPSGPVVVREFAVERGWQNARP